jgi:hypothetical protein
MDTQIKEVPPITENHKVVNNESVKLSITIGNAQIGGSQVTNMAGDILASGRVTNFDLGKGSTLKGTSIKVNTNIIDINDADPTHRVVTTQRFSSEVKSYKYEDFATNAGDIVKFQITYNFI